MSNSQIIQLKNWQSTSLNWIGISLKQIYKWNVYENKHQLSEGCKWRAQWDVISYLLGSLLWLKHIEKKRGPLYIDEGVVNWEPNSKITYILFKKIPYDMLQPILLLSITKGIKSGSRRWCWPSVIAACWWQQRQEVTQVPTGTWMEQENMVCTYNRILQILENVEILPFSSTWMHVASIILGEIHRKCEGK